MKTYKPKERDVILIYLADSQFFWARMQTYFKDKRKILPLSPGKLQRLQQQIEGMSTKSPNDTQIQLYLATIYETQGQIPQAISVLEKTLKNPKVFSDVYIRLGMLYESEGLKQDADRIYQMGQNTGVKLRPAVCLRKMPPTYNEFLVCALTSKVNQYYLKGFDEIVTPKDDNLKNLTVQQSVIRPGFLGRIRIKEVEGSIGSISVVRHRRLLKKVSKYLIGQSVTP